jgi:Mn2+/Fe2+ NRAMP family transporter
MNNLLKKISQVLKVIGPGFVWAVAAIGSGELIISSKTGVEYGLVFLWVLWLGLWLKYWIHKGILDITIITGKPIIDIWKKLKFGKIISFFWMIFFITIIAGLTGLLILTSSAIKEIFPFFDIKFYSFLIIIFVLFFSFNERYRKFEKIMLFFGILLFIGVLATLFISLPSLNEFTDWDIPKTTAGIIVFLSILGWSAGSGPDLIIPYSFWTLRKKVILKEENIKKRIKIAKWDAILGYLATGIVASTFMIAGSKILNTTNIEGLDVLKKISVIFTQNFGNWSFYFFILFVFIVFLSSILGVFSGVKMVFSHLGRILFKRIKKWNLISTIIFSLIPLILVFFFSEPVILILIAGTMAALSMPILAFLTIWSLYHQIPKYLRPNKFYFTNIIISFIVYLFFAIWGIYLIFK